MQSFSRPRSSLGRRPCVGWMRYDGETFREMDETGRIRPIPDPHGSRLTDERGKLTVKQTSPYRDVAPYRNRISLFDHYTGGTCSFPCPLLPIFPSISPFPQSSTIRRAWTVPLCFHQILNTYHPQHHRHILDSTHRILPIYHQDATVRF